MNIIWISISTLFLILNISKCSGEESDDPYIECSAHIEHDLTRAPCRWPYRRVPYVIDPVMGLEGFTSNQVTFIQKYIMDWNNRIPEIQFRPKDDNDIDYVRFVNRPGCWSTIGRGGGEQLLSLQSDGCLSPRNVQHEMMHAVGFYHEQTRPDRDHFIRVLWDNIPEKWRSQYKKIENTLVPNLVGPYEYYSVLHYPVYVPGSDKPTMRILDRTADIQRIGDRRFGLTRYDVLKIRSFYSDTVNGC